MLNLWSISLNGTDVVLSAPDDHYLKSVCLNFSSKQMIPSVVKMMMLSSKQRAGDCDDKQSLIDEMETGK